MGNVVTGNDNQTDQALKAGFLNVVPTLLQNPKHGKVLPDLIAVCGHI